MGVYGVKTFIKKRGINEFIQWDNFNCKKVCIDGEWLLGESFDISGKLDSKKFIEIVKQFQEHKIDICIVFGGEEISMPYEAKTDREFLKNRKNILKAFANLKEEDKRSIFKKYILFNTKIISCLSDFFGGNKKTCRSDIYYEVAKFHWRFHKKKRRISNDIIREVKSHLNNVEIYTAEREADELCAKLYKDKKVDYILSGDTDMIAFGANVILNANEKGVSVVLYKNFIKKCEEMGYSERIVKDSFAYSSSDFNYYLFDKNIFFNDSLNIIKNDGFHKALNKKMLELERNYEYKQAEIIRLCYNLDKNLY